MPADAFEAETFDYDAALLACARGDQQALKSIYLQDSKRLLGVALRIVRRRQVAEDVVHDAFVNIWNKAASFDARRGAGRGWIYSVVRHQALNTLREREVYADEEEIDALRHQSGHTTGHAASDVTADTTADAFEINASLGRLHNCLSQLDGAKRNSILSAYVDGCSHREIAQRLNAPLGSVKAWIKRGLSALRECMG